MHVQDWLIICRKLIIINISVLRSVRVLVERITRRDQNLETDICLNLETHPTLISVSLSELSLSSISNEPPFLENFTQADPSYM